MTLEEMAERDRLALADGTGPAREIALVWIGAALGAIAISDDRERKLEEIAALQPRMMAWFRLHEVVFDEMPRPVEGPSDWQQIAFHIYNALCEADTIARRSAD